MKRSTKLKSPAEQIAKMLAQNPQVSSKEIKAFGNAQGIRYTYVKNQRQPKMVSLNELLRSVKMNNSSEVAVTCLKVPGRKKPWQVVFTYNERPTTSIGCKRFLRDQVQRRFRRVKPSLKMTQVSAKIAELISGPELNKTQQHQAIKDHFEERKFYRFWTHVKRPQAIKLDEYITNLKGYYSTEFGVTCRDNAPDDPTRSDWTVVFHHNQTEMSERVCESYLTEMIKDQSPELKLNPRMAQVSNTVVKYLGDRSLTEAERQAQVKAAYPEEKRYLMWENVRPREIPLKELFSEIKRTSSTQFALSCSKFTEDEERRWAIAIHYR